MNCKYCGIKLENEFWRCPKCGKFLGLSKEEAEEIDRREAEKTDEDILRDAVQEAHRKADESEQKAHREAEDVEQFFSHFKDIFQQLVDDYDGVEIFAEENASRLEKAFSHIEGKFLKERETLLIACKRKIFQRLYDAFVDDSSSMRLSALRECYEEFNRICNDGFFHEILRGSAGFSERTWRGMLLAFSMMIYKTDISDEVQLWIPKSEPVETKREIPVASDVNNKDDDVSLDDGPIDDQDIRHWSEKKFYKNVYSSKQFREADLETKKEMRRASKEEAKLIKALRRDAGWGGGCYITTAICESSGKPDDCHELTMMRKFRDEWLAKQPDGMYIINDYYETAPKIVKAIDSLKNREQIYELLNKNFLSKCIRYVENNQMNDCKKCYMDMVQYCGIFLTN